MGKKKKVKNLEDFLNDLSKTHAKDIASGLKAYDDHSESDVQTGYLSMFIDGHQAMYNSFQAQLDEAFDPKDKIRKKDHDKVKGMVTKSLKEYFAKVSPGHLRAIQGMNDEDAFNYLVIEYDGHTGAGQKGSKAISLAKTISDLLNGEAKAGKFKEDFYKMGPQNSQDGLNVMNSKHFRHHVAAHDHNKNIHNYIKGELEKKGMEIKKDKLLGFWQADLMELVQMRQLYSEKKGHPYLTEKKAK